MLGVTLTPTMAHASDKINVIPFRAYVKVDCRVPPGLGQELAERRIREVLGGDGPLEIEFTETVTGNQSGIESPLMDAISRWVTANDPGAETVPVILPGFSDSRWFREAFPDCVAYGFFPQRHMSLLEVAPLVHSADERIDVRDLGFAAGFYADIARGTCWAETALGSLAQLPGPARSEPEQQQDETERAADAEHRPGAKAARERTGQQIAEPAAGRASPSSRRRDTRESARGGMYRASAVSHRIINKPKPKPVASDSTITSASGARAASAPPISGQASTSNMPVFSGLRRTPRQTDERAEDRTGARHALEQAEHAGAAVGVPRDDRCERVPRRVHG